MGCKKKGLAGFRLSLKLSAECWSQTFSWSIQEGRELSYYEHKVWHWWSVQRIKDIFCLNMKWCIWYVNHKNLVSGCSLKHSQLSQPQNQQLHCVLRYCVTTNIWIIVDIKFYIMCWFKQQHIQQHKQEYQLLSCLLLYVHLNEPWSM